MTLYRDSIVYTLVRIIVSLNNQIGLITKLNLDCNQKPNSTKSGQFTYFLIQFKRIFDAVDAQFAIAFSVSLNPTPTVDSLGLFAFLVL